MVTPVPNLAYSELTESEIRLVSFQESHHRRDHLRLRLQHFDLRQAPAYLALSYVWGDIGCERPINVNGSSLGVTNSVHDALFHIYNLSLCFEEGLGRNTGKRRKKLFLWIDSICINQKDMDEKAEQVPRMAQIYSSAFTVLVWLGTIQNLNPDPAAFNYLLSILVTIRPVSDFEIPRLDIQAPEPPSENDKLVRIVQTFMCILQNEWFQRVWILQEYCLSQRDPVALIGYATFSLRALNEFGGSLTELQAHSDESLRVQVGSLARLAMVMAEVSFGPEYMPKFISSERFRVKSPAEKLLWIITNIGSRASTVPHDHIYGVLGLINTAELPQMLMPDYRKSYSEVFKEYTRYLIEQTKDLRPLMCIPGNLADDQPSWTIDFQSCSPWALEPKVPHSGIFTGNGEQLIVEGVMTGKIVMYLPKAEARERRLQRFCGTFLPAAAQLLNQPLVAVWRTWLVNFLQCTCGMGDDALASARMSDAIGDFRDSISTGSSTERDMQWVLRQFDGTELALVDDGTISTCFRRLEDNLELHRHEVWAFKGAMQRYIVSKRDIDAYRYIGWLKESDIDLDSAFFSAKKNYKVTLL